MNRGRTRSSGPALLALSGALALLVGCQHTQPTPPAPPQQVESGSHFVLRAPLTLPVGNAELLFQNQQLVGAAKLSRDMPYCRLKPAKGVTGVIQPGTYTVSAVDYDEKEIGLTSAMLNVTRIALGPDSKQSTYALSCGWPEGAPSRAFVTTQQIYNAIGGHFSMDLLR
ncbi:MAG TPA: hypothetical protein VLC47_11570 [Burkholderiales bacterium]|nr:hypothetical protein [Burkholderiales bacterium]